MEIRLKGVPYLLSLFAVVAFGLSAISFWQSHRLTDRELPMTIAILGAFCCVGAYRTACVLRKAPQTAATARRGVSLMVLFFVSMIALWGGILSLWQGFVLCNQEYWHMKLTAEHRTVSISINSVIAESLTLGLISSTIGIFLFWYVFFHRNKPRLPFESAGEPLVDKSNPYQPPAG